MTSSEAPKALRASECSELLDSMRASCWSFRHVFQEFLGHGYIFHNVFQGFLGRGYIFRNVLAAPKEFLKDVVKDVAAPKEFLKDVANDVAASKEFLKDIATYRKNWEILLLL